MSEIARTEGVQKGAAESVETAEAGPRLRGQLGTAHVILTVMAFLAPLAATAGYISIVVGYGNGVGAPVTFLVVGAGMLLFSFGFLALVRNVPQPGAFYTYVTAGLGKRIGLGAGYLTLMFYLLTSCSAYGFGAVLIAGTLKEKIGLDLPWWVYVAVILVIVGFCAYRGIDFNARILGVIVAVEFCLVITFNLVTLARGGAEGHSVEPFTWDAISSGSFAVGGLFALAFFLGFEITAIYREEARDPDRTIPRATFGVIGIISVGYALTAYCLIIAIGVDDAVAVTSANPSAGFATASDAMLGGVFTDTVTMLVVTSVIASVLAVANATARYVYSFGVDGVLPSFFAAVHTKHGSPHRAAMSTLVFIGGVILAVVLSGVDEAVVYGIFSGVSTYGFEALLLLVSAAAIVYFLANRTAESLWSRLIAPGLSILWFGWLLWFSIARSELLLGTPTDLTRWLIVLMVVTFLFGVAQASYLANRRPEVYSRIGRQG